MGLLSIGISAIFFIKTILHQILFGLQYGKSLKIIKHFGVLRGAYALTDVLKCLSLGQFRSYLF